MPKITRVSALTVATSLFLVTGTAYLAELLEKLGAANRAADYAAITTTLGLGSGALLTSIALLYQHNSLTPDSYGGVAIAKLLCMAVFSILPEAQNLSGNSVVRLPYFPANTLKFSLALAVAWSVTGLIIAILPGVLAQHQLTAWTGLIVFLAIGTGAFVQPLARRMKPVYSTKIGSYLLTLA